MRQVEVSSRRVRSGSGPDIDSVYSNCDHQLNTDVAARLREAPEISAPHAAWNFNGRVWWDGELWREQVWRYGVPVAEYEAFDLEALLEHVNGIHGHE